MPADADDRQGIKAARSEHTVAPDQQAAPPSKRRRRWLKPVVGGVAAVLLICGGGAYWALNRYVIDHVQIADVRAYEAQMSAEQSARGSAAPSITDTQAATGSQSDADAQSPAAGDTYSAAPPVATGTSYHSGDTTITVSTVVQGSGQDTVTYYVADVTVGDATVIRSAFADNEFGQNIVEDTSAIAQDNNAVFAINGDYYGFRDTGIEIRNGVVFRDKGAREGLAMYRDGTVRVYDETTTTAADLVADGVWNTLSFGPALVEDGQVVSGIDDVEIDTNFGNHSIQGAQPRTAVGLIDANHYVFVVVDGRSPGYSAGVTMTGLAQIMQGLGAQTAYNLDGGGSSTMYWDGAVVNTPAGRGERGVSDILYIGAS